MLERPMGVPEPEQLQSPRFYLFRESNTGPSDYLGTAHSLALAFDMANVAAKNIKGRTIDVYQDTPNGLLYVGAVTAGGVCS